MLFGTLNKTSEQFVFLKYSTVHRNMGNPTTKQLSFTNVLTWSSPYNSVVGAT